MVMSQQPVSESVWMNHYRCATLAHVSRRFFGQVEIVPGVVGSEQIIGQRPALLTPDGGVDIQLDIRFDPRQRRYMCHEVRAISSTGDAVTTEVLRDLQIAHWIVLALLVTCDEGPVIGEIGNPDGREPWGKTALDGVAEHGADGSSAAMDGSFLPARLAVSYNPAEAVQESLPSST
jgi:hypothetical protein